MTRTTWLAAGAAALWASLAHADVLRATREQPMFEVSHTVDISIADGVATYKVRRQFANPGKVADEAGLAIDLPYGSAATGLRIRAHETWYEGTLMEREKAAALYHEMTGMGAYKPKDPALLQWLWADKLYLQVFPVMPGEVSTVEYTLTVPTRYESGRYWVSYPRIDVTKSEGSLKLATPIITVRPSWGDSTTPIVIDGKRIAAGTPMVLSPPEHQAWEEAVAAEATASYVASRIEVPASSHAGAITKASVAIDIKHTYRSDLRVQLLTPQGKAITLFDRKGGGDNNLITTFPVSLPAGTTGAGTWQLVVSDHAGLDTGTLDHWELAFGDTKVAATDTPVFIPDAPENASDAGVAAISIAPPPIATWTARLGRAVASSEHAFARLEIDTAPQLVPTPKRAQIVFVLDASFSTGAEMMDAQLALIRAYLTYLPDAEVEVIAYRRRAARVFGSFIAAKDVPAALEARRGALALGNGSAIDEGARLAATVLAARSGPRRVVITTDELLRTSLPATAALQSLAALSRETVVHVVVPRLDHDDRGELARMPLDSLAPLATKHHGIIAELKGLPAKSDKALAPIVLELVRPTRIDHLAVAGLAVDHTAPPSGAADQGSLLGGTKLLHEGDGVRVMLAVKTAPERVVLTGLLWSDPIRREVVASSGFSQATAAFVFGADEHQALSHDEMLTLAFAGRAVTPVTSYVAAEPGTRPSTIGLGNLHSSGSGSGYGSGMGMLNGVSHRMQPDLASLIDTTECVRDHHPAAGWHVTLTVETTRDEIVDVAAASDPLASCLAETAWNVRLTSDYDLEREEFTVSLGGS